MPNCFALFVFSAAQRLFIPLSPSSSLLLNSSNNSQSAFKPVSIHLIWAVLSPGSWEEPAYDSQTLIDLFHYLDCYQLEMFKARSMNAMRSAATSVSAKCPISRSHRVVLRSQAASDANSGFETMRDGEID